MGAHARRPSRWSGCGVRFGSSVRPTDNRQPEVPHGDADRESDARAARRDDDAEGRAPRRFRGGGGTARGGAGPADGGLGRGRVVAADPGRHAEPRQLRLRGSAQHRRVVREGSRDSPPRVPGLRGRADRAPAVERPAGLHGAVAEESGELPGAPDAPPALLLGHRGLRRPPDLRGAGRDACARPVGAAGGHDHQRRQLRRPGRRPAAVQPDHRLRRTGLPGRGVRHRRGGGSAPGRPAADPGPDAEPRPSTTYPTCRTPWRGISG